MKIAEDSLSPAIDSDDAIAHPMRTSATVPKDRTNRLVLALAVFAAVRILVFTLVFPLFNNVDEKLHFLTIRMYAHGQLPQKELPHIDGGFVREFLPYWSPEYDHNQEFINRSISPPLYQIPPEKRNAALAQGYYAWKLDDVPRRLNFEAQGAPLYYVVTGLWYDAGATLGLKDWRLAYWLRVLNPISYGLLVWFSYRVIRKIYPERSFLWLAVPALIAVFPQDVFFGMNRDVFPPTMWAAALLLMVNAIEGDEIRYRPLLLACFLVGLTFLLEVSNCVLYGALAATLFVVIRRSTTTIRRKIQIVITSGAAALALPVLWMMRNYLVIGDLTGTKAKMRNFGWTVKPFLDMWHHPVFSLDGILFFLVKLTRSVWHGDYDWHALPMRSALVDWFYVISSAMMILIFAINVIRRRRSLTDLQRWASFQAAFLVAGSILFLLAISMMFDYHNHGYPSRLHPFFVSGRIVSGALLPFAFIYASGLEFIASRLKKWIPPTALLACLLVCITASEIRVRRVAFSSPYNFFALSKWQQ